MIAGIDPAVARRQLIEECVNERVWAVVGASTNHEKWGYRVYRALKDSGYTVYPVNARATQIDGDQCYRSLAALPQRPAVVNVVAPPKIGLAVAEEAAAAGISYIWFQPGAESAENIALAERLGLKTVAHACALVERKCHW